VDGGREAGIYALTETLTLTPADSGTPQAPVTWAGEGEGATISGGGVVTGWTAEADGTWSAPIPTAPGGKPAYFEQLWVNGRRAERARLPNGGQERRVIQSRETEHHWRSPTRPARPRTSSAPR
jgi:hypothetical protein